MTEFAQEFGSLHEMFRERDAISLRDVDPTVGLGPQVGFHPGLEGIDLFDCLSDLVGVESTFE